MFLIMPTVVGQRKLILCADMTEEIKSLYHPISEALAKVYKKLYEIGEVKLPLYDTHMEALEVIVKNVTANYYGYVLYPTYEDQASAYFCFIIKNHPMADGNKRLAVLWLDIFCEIYGIPLNLSKGVELDVLAVSVENEKDIPIRNLIQLVRRILF